ncbi:MAG: molybdopterin-binding protein, partial [Pseudomonadales bacterium]
MATEFLPLRVAVLTLSDTRTLSEDRSGAYLESALLEAGHVMAGRSLCPDDRYAMRALVSAWIADPEVDVVLSTGGTGFT